MNKYTKKNNGLPLVVIFGRTNVGKSTLFNCLTEKRQALVSSIEGTTRDSNIGRVEWQNRTFEIVDTGGIIDLNQLLNPNKKNDEIQAKVEQQARNFIQQADLIMFVVDNKTGLLPQDRQMALLLKKILGDKKDNIILVVNKVDSYKQAAKAAEFNKLSLGEPITISATTGAGSGDLLEIALKKLPQQKKVKIEEEKEEIKVIMIGKPNVGKSSLLNSILGEERVIVSPIPHTTREPQDTEIIFKDKLIRLIDTAGISRKGQQAGYRKKDGNQLEKYGIEKSLHSLEKADIALLVLDINEEITHQDAKIVEEIVDRQKSIIIVANKWDLIEERNTKKFTESIYDKLPFINWAPIVFVSALTGNKVGKIPELILTVAEQRKKEISESILNTFLMRIVKIHKPAKGKGLKHPHIHKFEQINIDPPTFEIRIGSKDNLHFSYLNFINNRLREKFGFLGTPIRLWVRKNRKVHGKAEELSEGKQPKKPVRHQRRILRYH